MIASHYAEPVARALKLATALRREPDDSAEPIAQLEAGASFAMLDDSRGWAWGYAGDERRVGYVRSSAIA